MPINCHYQTGSSIKKWKPLLHMLMISFSGKKTNKQNQYTIILKIKSMQTNDCMHSSQADWTIVVHFLLASPQKSKTERLNLFKIPTEMSGFSYTALASYYIKIGSPYTQVSQGQSFIANSLVI